MHLSSIPIVDFYKYCLPAAAQQGYEWICTVVAREADCENLYEEIKYFWDSLDSVTSKTFLLLFAGKKNNSYDKQCQNNIRDVHHTWRAVYNDTILFIPSPHQEKALSYKIDEKNQHLLNQLSANQTNAANELKHFFGIKEMDIPCLILIPLNNLTIEPAFPLTISKVKLPENPDLFSFFKALMIESESTASKDIIQEIVSLKEYLSELDANVQYLREKLKNTPDRCTDDINKQIDESNQKKEDCQQQLKYCYQQKARIIKKVPLKSKRKSPQINTSSPITISNNTAPVTITFGDNSPTYQSCHFDYSIAKESLNNITNEIERLQLNDNELKQTLHQIRQSLHNKDNPKKISPLVSNAKDLLMGVSSSLLANEFTKFFGLF